MLAKQVKSVLNKHKKRDDWFLDDYSVNPYEGCSCNCLYCYIRGSKYGENLADKLSVKLNALEILEKELQSRARKNQHGFVAVGSATDAYLHQEEHYRMTEQFLQLLLKYRFPVFISTKRTLILRDLPILSEIDKNAILPVDLQGKLKRGVILSVSLSTMNENISSMLEPGAVPPVLRLNLVRDLKKENFLVGVNIMPVLPFISDNDEELEQLIHAAKLYGADYVLVAGLTLFGSETGDSKTLYYKFLERYNPFLIPEYEKLYNGYPFPGSKYQSMLQQKVNALCKKYEIRNTILENPKQSA